MRGRIPERWALDLYDMLLFGACLSCVIASIRLGHFFFKERVIAAVGCWSLAGLALRLGWVPTMMLWGTFIGLFCDPMAKGGTAVSKIQETVQYLSGGCVAGIVAGFVIEFLLDEARTRLQSPRSFDC